jgi:chemotaxis response regulator CheB
MSVMDAEVFDAFRSIGVADDKASAAAQAMKRQDPDILTIKVDMGVMKGDIATLKVDVALLKWMVGFIVAGIIALVLKAFVH